MFFMQTPVNQPADDLDDVTSQQLNVQAHKDMMLTNDEILLAYYKINVSLYETSNTIFVKLAIQLWCL